MKFIRNLFKHIVHEYNVLFYIYINEVFLLNYLWPLLIIISYIFALITGNIEEVNKAIFSSVTDVIPLTLTLVGNMCLWCGIMNIVKSTKIIKLLTKMLKPILNWLYPNEVNDKKVMNNISVNMVSNILGIGNAATPAGLQAMADMQNKNINKSKLTDSMCMLIVLNTTSIQLIPTTIIAIRSSFNSSNPSKIIIPIWIATFAGTIVAIVSTKILIAINNKKELNK